MLSFAASRPCSGDAHMTPVVMKCCSVRLSGHLIFSPSEWPRGTYSVFSLFLLSEHHPCALTTARRNMLRLLRLRGRLTELQWKKNLLLRTGVERVNMIFLQCSKCQSRLTICTMLKQRGNKGSRGSEGHYSSGLQEITAPIMVQASPNIHRFLLCGFDYS